MSPRTSSLPQLYGQGLKRGGAPSRLLLVTNSFERDAPTSMAVAVAMAAKRSREFLPGIFALSRGGSYETELEKQEILNARGGLAGGLLQLRALLRRFRPDVVHFHLARPALLGIPVAGLQHVPAVIATYHGAHEWWERGPAIGVAVRHLYPAVAQRASCVVAVSEAARGELLSSGLPREQTRVIYNGVDTMRFIPSQGMAAKKCLIHRYFPDNANDEITVVGCAGNLRRVKGHSTFIHAAAEVVISHPNTRFVLWGEGPERDKLQSEVAEYGLASKFVLAGHSAQLADEFPACDLFVQPSHSESFGLAAAEAMACSVPVVLSRVGGLPELGGDAAWFAKPKDPASLAAAIRAALADPAERTRRGLAARNRVLLHFSLEKMCRGHLDLYQSILAEVVR